ncbi:hypothetical protein TOK_4521 [Pseudonocardia sp. N23]|nr:hypothetical protein TOK_4521 [Pseudonocardia sp. N23]
MRTICRLLLRNGPRRAGCAATVGAHPSSPRAFTGIRCTRRTPRAPDRTRGPP